MRHRFIDRSRIAPLLIAAAVTLGPQSSGTSARSPDAVAAPFEVVTELDRGIFHIFQDSKGTYWFGSHEHGLYRRDENAFAHFTVQSGQSGLCDDQICQIQEDQLGNLYFTTGKGTSKFDGRAFTTLVVDDSDPSSTEWKLESGDLWFRCGQESHAVYRYDGKTLRKLTFPTTAAGDAHFAKYPRSKYPNIKYSPYDAYTIYKDRRGNAWFGTASLGACRYDGKTFTWISETELDFDEKDNRTFGTRSLIEDRDGMFWITVTRHRFDMYPPGSAMPSASGLPYIKTDGLPHTATGVDEDYTYIMSMVRDAAGDVWMATYGAGIWRYDGKTLTNYPVLVDGKPITVYSIYVDRQDGLWLGTHEHGVCKFDGKAFEKVKF